MSWENVYIFISSTFNDMHAERDFLMKRVFPELSEWCSKRKLNLIDVDLRWGITEKDAQENKRVVEVCLDHINECRPLFICFLGERRGWVPAQNDISRETLFKYPLLEKYIGNCSVTELEIIHAMIQALDGINIDQTTVAKYSLFFHRNSTFIEDIKNLNPAVLPIYTSSSDRILKSAIFEAIDLKNKNWFEYTCKWDNDLSTPEIEPGNPEIGAQSLTKGRLTDFRIGDKLMENVILSYLQNAITELYPNNHPYDTVIETEKEQQEHFIYQNAELYIEQSEALQFVSDYLISEENKAAVVISPAGTGKTTLMAHLIKEFIQDGQQVIYRFIGASDRCYSEMDLLNSLVDELIARGFINADAVPKTDHEIFNKFADILNTCRCERKVIMFIDGVDQLGLNIESIPWIPVHLNQNIKLIFTYKSEEPVETEKYHIFYNINTFKSSAVKRRFIVEYLSKYLKNIDEREIEAIIDIPGTHNPLFLKVLLSELRIFGSFERLQKKIKSFSGDSPIIAFERMLQRMEEDPVYSDLAANDAVPAIFGFLACARNGLHIQELAAMMEILFDGTYSVQQCKDAAALYIRQCHAFLTRRGGRIDLRYDSFRRSIMERYQSSIYGYHTIAANYFRNVCDPNGDKTWHGESQRGFTEYLYHLSFVDQPLLKIILVEYPFIERMLHCCDVTDLTAAYKWLTDMDRCHDAVAKCLMLSAEAIRKNVYDLPAQLWGRLCDVKNTEIQQLLEQMCRYVKYPWLKSVGSSLSFSDDIMDTLTVDGEIFTAVFVTETDVFLVWSIANNTISCGLYSLTSKRFVYKKRYNGWAAWNRLLIKPEEEYYIVLPDYLSNNISYSVQGNISKVNLLSGVEKALCSVNIYQNTRFIEVSEDCRYVAVGYAPLFNSNFNPKDRTDELTECEMDIDIYESGTLIYHYKVNGINHRDIYDIKYRFCFSADSKYAALGLSSMGKVVLVDLFKKTEKVLDFSENEKRELSRGPANKSGIPFAFIGSGKYILVRTNIPFDINDYYEKASLKKLYSVNKNYVNPELYFASQRLYKTFLYDICNSTIIESYEGHYYADEKIEKNIIFGSKNCRNIRTKEIQKYSFTVGIMPHKLLGQQKYVKWDSGTLIAMDEGFNIVGEYHTEGNMLGTPRDYAPSLKYYIAVNKEVLYVIQLNIGEYKKESKADKPLARVLIDGYHQQATPFLHKVGSNPHVIEFYKEQSFTLNAENNINRLKQYGFYNFDGQYLSNLETNPVYNRWVDRDILTTPDHEIKFGRQLHQVYFEHTHQDKSHTICMPLFTKKEIGEHFQITERDISNDSINLLTVSSEKNIVWRHLSKTSKEALAAHGYTKAEWAELLNKMFFNNRFWKALFKNTNFDNEFSWVRYNRYAKWSIGYRYYIYRVCLQKLYVIRPISTIPSLSSVITYDHLRHVLIYGITGKIILQDVQKRQREIIDIDSGEFITEFSKSGNILYGIQKENKVSEFILYNLETHESIRKISIINHTGKSLRAIANRSPSDPEGIYFYENDHLLRLNINTGESTVMFQTGDENIFNKEYNTGMDVHNDVLVSLRREGRLMLCDRYNELKIQHEIDGHGMLKVLLLNTDDGQFYVVLSNQQIYHVENYPKLMLREV